MNTSLTCTDLLLGRRPLPYRSPHSQDLPLTHIPPHLPITKLPLDLLFRHRTQCLLRHILRPGLSLSMPTNLLCVDQMERRSALRVQQHQCPRMGIGFRERVAGCHNSESTTSTALGDGAEQEKEVLAYVDVLRWLSGHDHQHSATASSHRVWRFKELDL